MLRIFHVESFMLIIIIILNLFSPIRYQVAVFC